MVSPVAGRQQLNSVTDLLDRLDRLRESGAEVQEIARERDSFRITYTSAGERLVREFTLPKVEAEFLAGAIAAGFVGAEAVNSGNLSETLLNYAAVRTGPSLPIEQLQIGRGAGKGS
jgi:hypothetical protein